MKERKGKHSPFPSQLNRRVLHRISVRLHSSNRPTECGTSMLVSCIVRRANSTCGEQPTNRLSSGHPQHQSTNKFYCLFEHFRYLAPEKKRNKKKTVVFTTALGHRGLFSPIFTIGRCAYCQLFRIFIGETNNYINLLECLLYSILILCFARYVGGPKLFTKMTQL